VRKVFLVIPHLDHTGPARLLSLFAASKPTVSVRVCVLGTPSPSSDDLRAEGVDLEVLHRRRFLDLKPLLSLNAAIRKESPDVVHAVGFGAAWPLVLSGARTPGKLVLSAALPPRRLTLAERWLLRHCARVIAFGQGEHDAYLRLGVPAQRLSVVPPAVAILAEAEPARMPGLPDEARVVLAVGPIERHKGHRDAVWAFDILRCLYDDLHLVIAGSGSDEMRVRRFTDSIRLTQVVHFPGVVGDLRPWLARAEVVWVPSLREGGWQTALEAMAAGRPVVASRLPGLAEVVVDGQTGFLVTPGDKAELARQTRVLLDHEEVRRAMGEAGRRHVGERFRRENMVEALVRVYEQR
jgi:glycosyltransferase involved in cell wall biosynthesis